MKIILRPTKGTDTEIAEIFTDFLGWMVIVFVLVLLILASSLDSGVTP